MVNKPGSVSVRIPRPARQLSRWRMPRDVSAQSPRRATGTDHQRVGRRRRFEGNQDLPVGQLGGHRIGLGLGLFGVSQRQHGLAGDRQPGQLGLGGVQLLGELGNPTAEVLSARASASRSASIVNSESTGRILPYQASRQVGMIVSANRRLMLSIDDHRIIDAEDSGRASSSALSGCGSVSCCEV
ncbi:hypothetical protein ABH935_009879 [Catenulispora sp. GAS73]|uniref:hypothetical protein n=1 Tax=Catenulispora sp. GAS73 TaxID=3156269 RepID=UPI003515A95C